MRDIIVHDDCNIKNKTFMSFIMFLEKSKGFEEDAKKFLLLTGNSSHLQIDYEMIRPMVIRLLKHQDSDILMEFFGNLSKNIQLNKSWDTKDGKEKNEELRNLRKNFYDGLIRDLMTNRKFTMAERIFEDKGCENFDVNLNDEFIGLNIYAS